MMEESALDTLFAKQACTELVYRLARALDRCDEGLLRSVFHPDATDDHGIFKGSADAFVAWVLPALQGMERTQHLIGNVLIEVSGNTASGEAYFIANHDMRDADGHEVRYIAAGRYLDSFERRDGAWRIAHRGCVYDWSATLPRSDGWDRLSGPRQYGERGHGDPSYAAAAYANLRGVGA